jgi:hypothetical protein
MNDHPEAVELAAAAPALEVAARREAVALTDGCQPRRPLRCWRYSRDSAAFPRWVLPYLTVQSNGEVDFDYPDNGGNCRLKDGWWVVEFDSSAPDLVGVYTGDEFAAQFLTVGP